MSATFTRRDREINRALHRFFWRSNMEDLSGLIISYITRTSAFLVYKVLIPFAVAYGLQAIITRHFDQVMHYAWLIIGLALAYCLLWVVGYLCLPQCRSRLALGTAPDICQLPAKGLRIL